VPKSTGRGAGDDPFFPLRKEVWTAKIIEETAKILSLFPQGVKLPETCAIDYLLPHGSSYVSQSLHGFRVDIGAVRQIRCAWVSVSPAMGEKIEISFC
jgi:hypothetical protein